MRIKDDKEIDEQLQIMEHDSRQFKIEFEQYFGGGKQRPPNDTEWRIEQMIKRYGDRGAELNYGQRFRYGNLAQTYVKFRDIFRKRMKKREEGVVDRHFGAAARKIASERAAKVSLPLVTVACNDPAHEPQKVEKIYAAFLDAAKRSGDPTANVSRQHFEKFLQQKVDQFHKQKGKHAVEFVISLEGGKARLKARVRG